MAPNAQFFNTLLVIYTRANHEEGVEQVLKELAERGFQPDVHAYTWRISKCTSVSKVQDMLQTMIDQGLRPNLYTIAAVVCVYFFPLMQAMCLNLIVIMYRTREGKDGAVLH